MKKPGHIILILFLFGLSMGCAPTLEYGRWPDTNKLEKLELHKSSMDEVRQVLGEPHGKGQGRTPDFPKLGTVWSYEYAVSTGTVSDFSLLLVFFIDERYYGYSWFSSQQKIQVSR